AHPQPEDVLLLIEVSDSTVKYDREEKIPLYAQAKIIEVWLVDMNEESVEVFREPKQDEYEDIKKFMRGESLEIQMFPDVNITVDEILG
nr:Uma2 family endonuclease [Nostocaceae cyanobacterium]